MHANSEIENACLNESAAFRPQCGIIATVFVILYNVDQTMLICHNKINLFVNIILYIYSELHCHVIIIVKPTIL